jgi:hypothetical protein
MPKVVRDENVRKSGITITLTAAQHKQLRTLAWENHMSPSEVMGILMEREFLELIRCKFRQKFAKELAERAGAGPELTTLVMQELAARGFFEPVEPVQPQLCDVLAGNDKEHEEAFERVRAADAKARAEIGIDDAGREVNRT